MKNLNKCAFCAALMLAGTATAQSSQDWDSDADGSVNRDEWSIGMNSSTGFSNWDADSSGIIEPGEFGDGLFDRYDADTSGSLSSAEWDDGIDNTYGEGGAELDFSTWDQDGNGELSREEFTSQYETSDLFDNYRTSSEFDTSAAGLSQEEFNTGMFDQLDSDDDDMLSAEENTWMQ